MVAWSSTRSGIAYGFFEGLDEVLRGGKYGFIDKTGRVVIEPQWEEVGVFSEGLARVERGGKYGFIDKTGRVISEPQWEDASFPFKGLAYSVGYVKRGGKWGVIDKTGRVVIEPQWDFVQGYQEASNAPLYWYFARQEGNKVVVVWLDSKGDQIWSLDNQSH